MNANTLTKTALLALTMGLTMASRPTPAHASGSDYYDDDDQYDYGDGSSEGGGDSGGGDCMRDASGNLWGSGCGSGYDPDTTYTVQVYGVSPPSAAETAFNIITNWTGTPGSIVSTFVSVLNFLGGSEANAAAYQQICTGAFQSPTCYGVGLYP